MIYVCSDIHGQYDRFSKLLDEIKFSDEDTLYILGDVIDRGVDGIEILKYIMKHKTNIHLFMGNHEAFMLDYLKKFHMLGKKSEKNIWFSPNNGGDVTYEKFLLEDNKTQFDIIRFLEGLPYIQLLEVNGKKYHLSHSGTIFDVTDKDIWYGTDLSNSQRNNIVWSSCFNFEGSTTYSSYPEGYYAIVGHVAVQRIRNEFDYTIFRDKNIIAIDGGCCYRSLEAEHEEVKCALACICLDNDKEFYVQ